MTRPCVTYTEVANAIARLQTDNKAITADNIRNLIGSGSKTTIVKHLKTWREAHILETHGEGLPIPLLESLKSLWTSVRNEANEEIAIHEAQADEKIEAMESVLNRSREQEATLNRENTTLQASLDKAQGKIEELSALLQAESTENVRLKEQNDGFERQCAQQAQEIERQHQIVKQTQINLEHYQAANLKLKEAHSLEREKERNAYMQEIRALEFQVSALSERKAVLEHTLEHVNKTLMDADLAISQLQTACHEFTDQANENKMKIALLEDKNQALVQQTVKQDQHLKESTEQLCSALNQISALTNKQVLLETDLQRAQDKVQTLMDEKMFLVQKNGELNGHIKSILDK